MYAATTRNRGVVPPLSSVTTWVGAATRTVRARPALTGYVTAICMLGLSVFGFAVTHLASDHLVVLAVLVPLGFLTECLVLRSSPVMTQTFSTLLYLVAIPLVPP